MCVRARVFVQVRDIHHDNLTRFVGAVIDKDYNYIVTEYCSKGSLQVKLSALSQCHTPTPHCGVQVEHSPFSHSQRQFTGIFLRTHSLCTNTDNNSAHDDD